ncbi:MAG: GNAT family N-acetyltransferase [Candidatus Dormibacteraeota bacterium]|nr:GNAT family N-acetyltransferase [Candidatus Dormibacteraeota bacterium]
MAGDLGRTAVSVVSALGRNAQAWDRLVDRMALPSPFLRSWWLANAAGGEPYILLVVEGDRLIGGLALERDRHLGVERLRTLGSGVLCPDHLDAVAAPGRERLVVRALRSWLSRAGDVLLDLDGVVEDPLLWRALPGRVRRDLGAVAPFMRLGIDVAQQGSRSVRRRAARAERRLVKESGGCVVAPVDDTDEALRLLQRLHTQRWGGASGFLDGFTRFAALCHAAAAQGELAVSALRAGDEAVAVMAAFEVAGRISNYQSGRETDHRWRGVGTLLLARVIDDAGRRGISEVDLLRGDEAYKSDFATGRRGLWRLRCATGPRSAIALAIDLGIERARGAAGRARWAMHERKSGRPVPPA